MAAGRPSSPRRRVRRTFVLCVVASVFLLALLGATIFAWEASPRWPLGLHISNRMDRSYGAAGHLMVDRLLIDGGPVFNDGSAADIARMQQITDEAWRERDSIHASLPDSTLAFQRLSPMAWAAYCRTWLVQIVLALPLALALWGAWKVRPRWPAECCQRCGYDRTGLTGKAEAVVCPECGAAATP